MLVSYYYNTSSNIYETDCTYRFLSEARESSDKYLMLLNKLEIKWLTHTRMIYTDTADMIIVFSLFVLFINFYTFNLSNFSNLC